MLANDLPNTELGLCCRMLHHCAWANSKTINMTSGEMLEILGKLFPEEVLAQTRRILSGEEEYPTVSEIRHEQDKFDSLHKDLMKLLDLIDTQHNPALASRRFDLMESYGYTTTFLNGPIGLVDS